MAVPCPFQYPIIFHKGRLWWKMDRQRDKDCTFAIANPTILPTPTMVLSFSGTRPTNLGVTDGKLAACPSSPNCVNSQTPQSDGEHYIEPIACGDVDTAMARLRSIVDSMARTTVVTESENYLYAEFKSALMGYVDDVEFYLDKAAGALQVRSASRVGKSDLGVNRKRIEAIRAQLNPA